MHLVALKGMRESMNNTSTSVTTNFIWRFLERSGAQAVSLIVSIVLARILSPSTYGIIAIVTVFTNVLQVFIDSGMGSALIQKKNADDLDFSTVFYFNFAVCLTLYIFMFIAAPFIAKFYNMPDLIPVVRVLSLTLVISGVKNVQQAYVSRNMLFKRFFFSTLGGTITAAVVGITMAYCGFGVWALITQQLVNASIDTLILWVTVKWRPKLMFSFERLKGLFSYGWKLLVSGLLETVYTNMRQLIIGKMYSSSDLAYYNQGDKYTQVIVTNINTSIDSVLLPTMSRVQDDPSRVRAMTRRSIKVSTYIIAPMMLGIASIATPLVKILLTEKWLPCVPYLIIFCITYMFYPIHTANLNAIKAMGRSDLFLKLEILKKIIGLSLVFVTMWFGPLIMAASQLISCITSQLINSWPNKKLLNYPYKEQLMDILPNIGSAAIMFCGVWGLRLVLPFNGIIGMGIQVVTGILIYLGTSILTKNDSLFYILDVLKQIIKRR